MVSIIKMTLVFFALSLLSTGEAKYLESDYYDSIKEEAMDYNEDSDTPSAAMEYYKEAPSKEPQAKYLESDYYDSIKEEAMDYNEESDTPSAAMEYYKEAPSKEPQLDELEQMTDKYSQQQEEDCTDDIMKLIEELKKCAKDKDSTYLVTDNSDNCKSLKKEIRICEKPATCKEVQRYNKNTGNYTLHVNGKKINVTCEMGGKCGRKGPWTLREQYQLQESEASCPKELERQEVSGVRICTKYGAGCRSVKLMAEGIKYSEVCGMVTGYQKGSTDAFRIIRARNVRGNYVDGVSVTQGKGRKHIWTYAAGVSENYPFESGCPCNKGNTRRAPRFVGKHYYCESAFRSGTIHPRKFQVYDKLWDGHKFRGPERKCRRDGMPWFYRNLKASADYIEIRLCTNEKPWNENIGIGGYEFYTK